MKKTLTLKYPGFYIKVLDNATVTNPKGWQSTGKKRIFVENITRDPRENDIAEVLDIDKGVTPEEGTYLCKDIDGFMFAIEDSGVEFFAKNWPEAADRIKKEFSISA